MTQQGSSNSAVVKVKGDMTKKDDMKAEMEKANFKSVRGPFKYGKNHIPVQKLLPAGRGQGRRGPARAQDGRGPSSKDDQDRFADKCPMK